MAEPATGGNTDPAAPVFQLQRVYLKDASLELPHAPTIFLEQEPPQVEVQLEVTHEKVLEGIYEVVVRATTTAKVKDKVLFLVEAKQAGIFELRGIPAAQFDAVVGIVCPNIVYPYLRANVADLVNRTGLPPIHLAEINFEALYQQRLAQQSQGLSMASGQMPQ
ncbi:MAG: protein-export chaperone SecB [Sutterellaceae bacterium]|nr:protein-export chaperone SecB [Burkholderiaceae bacterium]MCX7901266.1 protein-export chaperone SecB [Burkholderiaceae bacterium]MDW8429413.1 protein-export chaperone SecB [Sutterellaceae bacterium]